MRTPSLSREATANLERAAALDPAAAAAHLDELHAACEQRIEALENGESYLQTISDVREHEAALAELHREREAYASARGAAYVTAAESRRTAAPRPTRIVVADDDSEIRALLASALRHDGHQVAQATDGLELLRLLSAVSTHELEPPAAIISDVRMPHFDGLDVLRNARSLGVDVPIILMTAFRDSKISAKAQELGACALFDKPFDMDLLLRWVDDVVARAA